MKRVQAITPSAPARAQVVVMQLPPYRVKVCALSALVLAGSLLVAAQSFASGAAAGPSVGEVSMVLGKAWIETTSGRQRVTDGMLVRVSDKIYTAGSGHVHIRFKDNALVSIRPESQFEIVRYDYDAANPEASVVKFNVEEGVVRAISGEAAKHARANFRLNTPIAAIGVRGTDFVVSSSQETVRAQVNEGTIVVAPYSGSCSMDAFGPCQANALELSGAANQIVEVNNSTLNPVFLPATGRVALPPAPEIAQRAVTVAPKNEAEKTAENPYVSSVTTRVVTTSLTGSTVTNTPPDTSVVPLPAITPATPVPAQALAVRQLLWGRWSEGNVIAANERITVNYDLATADNRQVTIRNDRGTYGLFRIEDGPNVVKPGLGLVGFTLNQAQATFSQDGVASLMSVSNGKLNIDFEQSRFSTSLDLNHAATGSVKFSDTGSLSFGGGYFYSRNPATPDQVMAGAVSLDGTEAGYSFEKTLPNGLIEGITLWGRQP